LPPAHAGLLFGLFVYPEDGGDIFIKKKLVDFQRTIPRYIPEDRSLQAKTICLAYVECAKWCQVKMGVTDRIHVLRAFLAISARQKYLLPRAEILSSVQLRVGLKTRRFV
jgi:hypothetical protein